MNMNVRVSHYFGAGALLLLCIGGAVLTFATPTEEIPVLDLTTKREGKPWLRAPGSMVSVISGGPKLVFHPPRYQLPLQAKIRRVKPSRMGAEEKFIIELELRNTGDTPFYLPQLRDRWKVHPQGNKGRRTFLFSIKFFQAGQWEEQSALVASTDGAETVPESLLRLDPQRAVLILLRGDLGPIQHRLSSELREVSLRVVCKEWTLEDERYFIQKRSENLESANDVSVTIIPEQE